MEPSVPSTSAQSMPSRRTILVRLALSTIPLAVFVWFLRAIDLPLRPSAAALAGVKPLWIVVYGVSFLVVILLRGIRWRWLVQPFANISLRTSMDLTSIGNAAIVAFPMRSGEVVRPILAKRYGISALAVLSTVGAERIIDGLCVGLLVFVSLSLAPGNPQGLELLPPQFRDPQLVTQAARVALGGFSVALALLLLFYWRASWMERMLHATVGRASKRLAERMAQVLVHIASGLSFLSHRRQATWYVATTLVFWLLQVSGIHLLLWACGFEQVPFIESCAVTGVFALGFLLPSPPGFFGAFQTTLYLGLLLYFPAERVTTAGASVVFFAYVIQLGLTLLVGLFCYIRERIGRGYASG